MTPELCLVLCGRTEEQQNVTSIMGLLCGCTISHARFICLPRFAWKPRAILLRGQEGCLKPGAATTGSVAVPSPQGGSALCPPVSRAAAAYMPKHSWCWGYTTTCHTLPDCSEVTPGLLSAQTLNQKEAQGSSLSGPCLVLCYS